MAIPILQEISRILELAEVNTCADLWSTLSEEAAPQLGLRLEKIGSATASSMSNVDIGEFNRVLGVGIAEPAIESAIDRIAALYAPAGNTFVMQVDPTAEPAELPNCRAGSNSAAPSVAATWQRLFATPANHPI